MRLVRDHGVPTGCQLGVLLQRIKQGRESLDGDDDDPGLLGQRFGQLVGFTLVAQIAIDGAHDALSVLKLVYRVLQLAIQNCSVGYHDDRAEQLLSVVIVELGQLMG